MSDTLTQDNLALIRKKAIDLLARREHTVHELSVKLLMRFKEPELIAHVLSKLTEENIQSDQRFVESFVNYCYGRGKGPLFIRHALQERYVKPSLINTFLDQNDTQWTDLAKRVYQKYCAKQPATDRQAKSKQMRFMQQRGFTRQQIDDAMQCDKCELRTVN